MEVSFAIERDESGDYPIRFSCPLLVENNNPFPLTVEYFYDVLYDSSLEPNISHIIAEVESDLLDAVANSFGLHGGVRCSVPPVDVVWLIDITSEPKDEAVLSLCKLPKRELTACPIHSHISKTYTFRMLMYDFTKS